MLHALAVHLTVPVEVPNPKPAAPPEIAAKVEQILGLGLYLVIAGCVAGIFMVAGRAALAHRRGELADVMGQLAAVAIACVLVATGSTLVGFLA